MTAPTAAPPRRLPALGASLLAVAVVAGLGRLVTRTGPGSWYSTLEQPSWNPPDWLFGPMWTLLYVLMAVAAWRCLRRPGHGPFLAAYAVQLALNLAWTMVFFGLESPGGGVAVIAALLLAIGVTIALARPLDRVAAWLLAPYLAWVAYAAALTVAIAAA